MTDFTMPSLGADMEAGTFVEWKVKAGDTVKRGDVVCVIETQKGAVDVEIWDGGVVAELVARPGEVIPVGGVLARLVGEAAAPVTSPPAATEASGLPATTTPAVPPARSSGMRVSPAARRRAEELGVSLEGIAGTGPDGAVTVADVEARAPAAKPMTAPTSSSEAMRAAIASAMTRAKREIPHYYLGHEIRVDPALDALANRNAALPMAERILFAAIVLRAVALALRETPLLNGHFVDGAFRPGAGIHVGVAIALRGGGLIAPAIHDTDTLDLLSLMARLKDLLQRARGGQLRSSEVADATLTVTNLGDLGVQTVYGVIHPPQVALVGWGRTLARPWVVEDRVVPARVAHATLSADHRVSDGLQGARFLAELDRLMHAPEELM